MKTKHPTAVDYLTCTEKLLNYGFTKKEVAEAIKNAGLSVRDLTDEKGHENFPNYLKLFEVVKESHSFTVKRYRGEYVKEETTRGWLIRQPATYQGLNHGAILEKLFEKKFPFFSSFKKTVKEKVGLGLDFYEYSSISSIPEELRHLSVKELLSMTKPIEVETEKSLWDLYEMSTGETDYEMYLNTEKGALYVPLTALLKKDFSIIEKRMKEYFGWYYKDNKKELKKSLSILETDTAKKLKQALQQ